MKESNSGKLVIRDVSDGDMVDIHEIYAEQVLHGVSSWEEEPPPLAEIIHRRDAIVAAGHDYLIGQQNEKVVGFAYVTSFRPRVGYLFTVENSIYVSPNSRGLGIGQKLLQQLITKCEAKGFRQMVAVIGDSDNQVSIDFHRKMGFQDAGKIRSVGFKFGRWMDSVIMQLPLGDGDQSLPE